MNPETRPYSEVRKGYTAFLSGDVIMAKITPCMENGKTALVPNVPGDICFGSTEFHVVRPEKGIDPKWIEQFLLQHETRREARRQMAGGVGQMRVPAEFLKTIKIPIAPPVEQTRIVEALDELFSDLDAGVAALERARERLKLYRASVLKAAVEGTLTADWRAEHPDVEPASALLERILVERRRLWEEDQLRKFAAKGKPPPKNWRARYKEPVAPDTTGLPTLPKGWAVASMDAVTTRITSGSRDWRQYYGSGSGTFIMAQNVTPGRYNPEFRQAVDPPPKDSSRERSRVEMGDILVTIVGANTGNVCHIPYELSEHYVCQSVALMRPVYRYISSFLDLYCNSSSGAQPHYARYIYGAGRPHLGFDQLAMTPVLLPPVDEQNAIVESVKDQLSIVDHLETDIDAKLKTARGLRQAILRQAFAGELVPRDPDDEPASELLKRIAAARAARARDAAAARRAARKTGGAGRRGRPRKRKPEKAT